MTPWQEISWISGLLLFTCVHWAHGGVPVTSYTAVCLSEQPRVIITCPTDHRVAIESANFYKSIEPGCHKASSPDILEDGDQVCMVHEANKDLSLFPKCWVKNKPCNLNLNGLLEDNEKCDESFLGEIFFVVAYECQPDMSSGQHTVDMCETNDHWTGSTLYILSAGLPKLSNDHQCGCTFSVHDSADIEINIKLFEPRQWKSDKQTLKEHPCSQSLTFWTEFGHKKICSEARDKPLQNIEMKIGKDFHVQYDNPLGLMVKYWLVLNVHHDYEFNATCSDNFTISAPTTTRSPLRITGKTTTLPQRTSTVRPDVGETKPTRTKSTDSAPAAEARKDTDDQSGLWQMIAGILAALLVMVLIIVGLVIYCKKRKPRTPTNKTYEQDLNNAFENTEYMHPEQVLRTGNTASNNQDNRTVTQQDTGAAGYTPPPPPLSTIPVKPGFENFAFESEVPSSGDPYKEYLERDHKQDIINHYNKLQNEAQKK